MMKQAAKAILEFNANDVAACFDAGTLNRGRSYAQRGMVRSVTVEGDAIKGKVNGSGQQSYRQTIHIKPAARGVRVDGDCSCPMDHNCKHVVAVLLRYLELAPAPPAAMAADGMSPQLDSWLRSMAKAIASKPAVKRTAIPTQAIPPLSNPLASNA